MREFNIGEVIREQRVKKRISQLKLSFGVCDASNLSRIEQGKQTPSPEILKELMERLGVIGERYQDYRALVELEIEEYKNSIKNANARHDYLEAITLRNEMVKKFDCSSEITQQFLKWTDAINGRIVDGKTVQYPPGQRLNMLIEAIRITSPLFSEDNMGDCLLSLNETIIAINIANTHITMGERPKAIILYGQLLKYIKRHLLDYSEGALIIPLLTFNYSSALEDEKCYQEEHDIAQIGINCCAKYKRATQLGELLANKSVALHELGRDDESKEAAIESYYVLKTMQSYDRVAIIKQYLQDTHNVFLD